MKQGVAPESKTKTVRDLLRRVREGLGACVKHEDLYWQVLNGTRLAYRLCTTLMRPERAADAIETLAWCALCMEGMLPLLAPRFCEWRVQLYTALCHCYEAAGMLDGAAKAVVLESGAELDEGRVKGVGHRVGAVLDHDLGLALRALDGLDVSLDREHRNLVGGPRQA